MAQVWTDISAAMNNEIYANAQLTFQFVWQFVTFSGETQDAAEVRWRKFGAANAVASGGMFEFMRAGDALWSAPVSVGRLEDTTTWTLSGGQYVPPAEANRRYSNITNVNFPLGFFSPGIWGIQVRIKPTGQDWSGWSTHRVEISDYDDRQQFITSTGAAVKGPAFPNEGTYGVRVEVVSSVGISAVSAEQQFNVWETSKYLKDSNGVVRPIPENTLNEVNNIVRVRRKQ